MYFINGDFAKLLFNQMITSLNKEKITLIKLLPTKFKKYRKKFQIKKRRDFIFSYSIVNKYQVNSMNGRSIFLSEVIKTGLRQPSLVIVQIMTIQYHKVQFMLTELHLIIIIYCKMFPIMHDFQTLIASNMGGILTLKMKYFTTCITLELKISINHFVLDFYPIAAVKQIKGFLILI